VRRSTRLKRPSPALLLLLAGLGGCTPEAPPRSAVLIVVDTLRADHLGLYGSARPTSPNLDRRAARAAVFEQALSASPRTLP
jgi:glucan phosphoethanolaminetransferase (alkaline phosphatase superfamily)